MAIARLLEDYLNQWKNRNNRKPLILRGARQVGKTTLINSFASSYSNFIYLNLEKATDKALIDSFSDVNQLCNALFIRAEIQTDLKSETLLFIDEIQESPKTIQLLRYFYEEIPDLHLIAAGSLLEFALKDVKSFPVGRVEFAYLHPLNFIEFLTAINKSEALEAMQHIPIKRYAHKTLMNLFHQYAIIGGMPEIVAHYSKDNNIANLQNSYESIWETYIADVSKYGESKKEANVIKHILESAPIYLDERITFHNFAQSNYRSAEVSQAFRSLDKAKVIQLIYPTIEIKLPLKINLKKKPRMQILDSGLVNYALNIQAEMLTMEDLNKTYKGALIPHLINQEIISKNQLKDQKPSFWVRDSSQSSAEVDLILACKGLAIPVEIKSGPKGKLRSLHEFIDRCEHNLAVRVYGGEFSLEQHKTPRKGKAYHLMNIPYYLGTLLPEYIEELLLPLKD